eukprot:11228028-Lingulodinium_polyedra.AAC.1
MLSGCRLGAAAVLVKCCARAASVLLAVSVLLRFFFRCCLRTAWALLRGQLDAGSLQSGAGPTLAYVVLLGR